MREFYQVYNATNPVINVSFRSMLKKKNAATYYQVTRSVPSHRIQICWNGTSN